MKLPRTMQLGSVATKPYRVRPSAPNQTGSIFTGLFLTFGLALVATFLHLVPGLHFLSSLILAVVLGIAVRNVLTVPASCQPGIKFTLKRILRLAIMLLGLRLSASQILEVGPKGLGIVAVVLGSTFIFTCWLGRQLGVSRQLSQLIASGTSICGASAVVATNSVIEGSDEDVAYAVTIVTVFGTLSMLLYPLLFGWLALTPEAFGVWTGASIHEVAQVVAAAFQTSPVSGELATIAKLSRVMFLIPVMLTLGVLSFRQRVGNSKSLPIPWFVLGFVVLIGVSSFQILPIAWTESITQGNKFLLTVSMVAMGLETKLHKFKEMGLRPLYLGAAAWLFISILSLTLVEAFYL
ncbi:YeiH family putative sulfate export transporter [Acaryochloris sp. 'Moss Beach']|uniref:YeiH family protein n=1 Tax=Acaryochloris TaxID=155977 RepID=UPI001F4455AB|nr:YeiH family protein [Acaryochloris sp. 'Moss Beach']UJB68240.1 YeiH family putative sulfate export transporter [Acaryochloris sp. 'Moss Beach']